MLPFIHDGYDVELCRKSDVMTGDIVLVYTRDGRFVLHRVADIQGEEVTLMGDGNLSGTEQCLKKDISGTVLYIFDRKGRRKQCDSVSMKVKSWIWVRLKPLRRYILGIYRRLICV